MSVYSISIVHYPRYSNSYSSAVFIIFCYLASLSSKLLINSYHHHHHHHRQLFSSSMLLFIHEHDCHLVFVSLCSHTQLFSSVYVLVILSSSTSTVLVIIHCYHHPLSSPCSIKRYTLIMSCHKVIIVSFLRLYGRILN